ATAGGHPEKRAFFPSLAARKPDLPFWVPQVRAGPECPGDSHVRSARRGRGEKDRRPKKAARTNSRGADPSCREERQTVRGGTCGASPRDEEFAPTASRIRNCAGLRSEFVRRRPATGQADSNELRPGGPVVGGQFIG